MNENDLTHLSYKELQALASAYRVPGNIKKHLLIRTLQAKQSGNQLEVDRMLTEVRQTRKKRIKKQKLNHMNVSSSPIHSPNYTISDDCYYKRHQPPYQWVGAEEEISVKEDTVMKVPNYMEFQQFLFQRLQRDQYHGYNNLSKNDVGQGSSIVDLRTGAGSSVLRPLNMETNNGKLSVPIDPSSFARSSSEIELQIPDNPNDISQTRPELLKKLLEAPVGANLGEIASPDANSQRIWSVDEYANNSGNNVDDSDTLTAESDTENDDFWDNSNNNNNNNNNAMDYYSVPNNQKNHLYSNGSDMLGRNTESVGQLRNNFSSGTIQQYSFGYHVTDIQSNCDKWVATNNFVNRDASYTEHISENSRYYNSVYYENNVANSTVTRPINVDRKFQFNEQNEGLNYGDNQAVLHGQRFDWSTESHPYYQNNNAVVNPSGTSNDPYYTQQTTKQAVPDVNREYYAQGTTELHTIQNSCQTEMQSVPQAQFTGHVYNKDPATTSFHNQHENNNDSQYNSNYYPQYSHQQTEHLASFSGSSNPNQQHYRNSDVAHEPDSHKNATAVSTTQTISNGVLDPYWPRWPMNSSSTSNGNLETILNLHSRNGSGFDYSKKNETSCVYCYTEPIVTQRIEANHMWSTQIKPPIAESRQHLFTPNVLVYNDASTGMIMANISEPPKDVEIQSQDPLKMEDLNLSKDRDYELGVSDDSSESSINDVWIYDYANYPVSSDNALQSADLTNDENDDDLFSTVRDSSQNSIDDQTIENFTDISY